LSGSDSQAATTPRTSIVEGVNVDEQQRHQDLMA